MSTASRKVLALALQHRAAPGAAALTANEGATERTRAEWGLKVPASSE